MPPSAGISWELEGICFRALEKNPALRFKDGQEFATALGSCSRILRVDVYNDYMARRNISPRENRSERLNDWVEQFGKADAKERQNPSWRMEKYAIIRAVEDHLEATGAMIGSAEFKLALKAASALESINDPGAADTYIRFARLVGISADATISRKGLLLIGAARRLQSIGSEIQIKGKSVTGKEIDVRTLRGKVVLVDFCDSMYRRNNLYDLGTEFLQIKKVHERYREHGFDIVSVFLDHSETDLAAFLATEKLPWTCIHDKVGEDNNQTTYGIVNIPRAILIDRDGRIISLQARGSELERLLSNLIPGVSELPITTKPQAKRQGGWFMIGFALCAVVPSFMIFMWSLLDLFKSAEGLRGGFLTVVFGFAVMFALTIVLRLLLPCLILGVAYTACAYLLCVSYRLALMALCKVAGQTYCGPQLFEFPQVPE